MIGESTIRTEPKSRRRLGSRLAFLGLSIMPMQCEPACVPVPPSPGPPIENPNCVPGEVIRTVQTAENSVMLSIDDVTLSTSPALIAELDRLGVDNVAMFAVGSHIQVRPSVAADMARDHYMGEHSMTHSANANTNAAELGQAKQVIEEITGDKVFYSRPSGLAMNQAYIDAARTQGTCIIMASIDPVDWQVGVSSATVCSRVVDNLHPGGSILLHDRINTINALECIVNGIRDRGYQITPLPDWLALGPHQ